MAHIGTARLYGFGGSAELLPPDTKRNCLSRNEKIFTRLNRTYQASDRTSE